MPNPSVLKVLSTNINKSIYIMILISSSMFIRSVSTPICSQNQYKIIPNIRTIFQNAYVKGIFIFNELKYISIHIYPENYLSMDIYF